MGVSHFSRHLTHAEKLKLVPRLKGQGYTRADIEYRRSWLEKETGCSLQHVAHHSLPCESLRGNIENPIGAVQVPLGVAGPLLVEGAHARGSFYVPMATTEGVLLRSYERGMVALARSGGVHCHIYRDENRVAPVFLFENIQQAAAFADSLPKHLENLRAEAEATTRHGKLLGVEAHPIGREVIVNFRYHTADAHGMNMISKATLQACRWLMAHSNARHYYIFSGLGGEKRTSGFLFQGGKGKKVVAGAKIPRKVLEAYLHVEPEQIQDLWHHSVLSHLYSHAAGFNAHLANGITAIFLACGQDVANVANAANGLTHFEVTAKGDLYASVTLPSLTLATVGGGVDLGTGRECLEMLGCHGSGKAPKLAEIVAAALLAGELSFSAAIACGEFVEAHETYGRNRPQDP